MALPTKALQKSFDRSHFNMQIKIQQVVLLGYSVIDHHEQVYNYEVKGK